MKRRAPERPGRARGGGFTLVELVIALALAGLVAAAVVGVLVSQHEFYARSSDRAHARQSVRAAADLISAELRLVAPRDLLAAEPDSVSARLAVLRGVVCGAVETPAGDVAVFAFDTVTNPNLPPRFRGYAYSDPGRVAWHQVDGAPLVVSPRAGESSCVSRGAPGGEAGWRYRTVGGWHHRGSFGSVPERGAVLTKYGRLTYSVEISGSYPEGAGVYRNSQELVSPFADDVRFSYLLADGRIASRVAPADLTDVRAIRIVGTALGPRSPARAESDLRLHVPLQR